ncbi:MAG: FtsW/RodA/SpoVE family cell cycle protein [Microgenomates group bacterium]
MKVIKKGLLNTNSRSTLVIIPILLTVFGLFFIFEASSVYSFTYYGDSFYFLKLQLIWFLFSFLIMFFLSRFNYRHFYYLAFYIMILTILLLMVVLIPGIGHQVKGARRWIDFGFFNFQPTELAKLAVIIYLSAWFSYKERKRFFSFITLLGFLTFLIILQPDMGTALIIFLISISIYIISDNPLWPLIIFFPLAILIFYFFIQVSPYRLARLQAYLNPESDPLGIGYHINQILVSLKNGGFFGVGFAGSRQKYLFLPEAHTDSIFAIIAEDFGFIGGLILIIAYLYFLYKVFALINLTPDRFAKLLISGIFFLFNFQILINLAGIVNLIPLTGISLPFISYGGSNLLISYALLGILINIAKKIKKL